MTSQGKDENTRGTDAPSLMHETKTYQSLSRVNSLELTFLVKLSKAQSDAEIRSLPKAGYCLTITSTPVEVRTGRIYS